GRLLTLHSEGTLQAPLALALATDIEALGAGLPVGALVVQDIPAATGHPAALRLHCTAARVWDGSVQASPHLTPPVLAQMATTLAAGLCRRAPRRGVAPLARLCRRGNPVVGRARFRVSGGQARIRPTQPFLPVLGRDATGLPATCAAIYPVLAP